MTAALYGSFGFLTAAVHTIALAWNTRLYASRALAAGLVHVARTVAVATALLAVARAGRLPLLATIAGFACAQPPMVAAAGRRL